jgi:PHD-finger
LVCGSEEENNQLLCSSCPRAYHTSCLTPPLPKVIRSHKASRIKVQCHEMVDENRP